MTASAKSDGRSPFPCAVRYVPFPPSCRTPYHFNGRASFVSQRQFFVFASRGVFVAALKNRLELVVKVSVVCGRLLAKFPMPYTAFGLGDGFPMKK